MLEFKITDDLQLRVPTEENAEEIYRVVMDNHARLGEWMVWATDDYNIESTRAFVRQNLDDITADKAITFSIFYKDKIVGGIGLHDFDREQKQVETGYWINSACEGKGIVTACCRALIKHVFEVEKMETVEIVCSSLNLRSRAVAEQLGFTLKGIFEGVHPMPGGKFNDSAIYSITRKTWQNRAE